MLKQLFPIIMITKCSVQFSRSSLLNNFLHIREVWNWDKVIGDRCEWRLFYLIIWKRKEGSRSNVFSSVRKDNFSISFISVLYPHYNKTVGKKLTNLQIIMIHSKLQKILGVYKSIRKIHWNIIKNREHLKCRGYFAHLNKLGRETCGVIRCLTNINLDFMHNLFIYLFI